MATYRGAFKRIPEEINAVRNDGIEVHRIDKEYVITRFGKIYSPHMTAKECYKALLTLKRFL